MNSFKSLATDYAAHAAGYVLAAATIVSGLDPKLFPPQYAFVTALATGLVTAVSHGYQLAQPATVKPVDAATTALTSAGTTVVVKALLLGLLFVGVGSGLVACKTAPTATEQAGISVAVDIATGAAIQNGGTSDVWKARAVKFKAIAVSVKQVNDAGTATLATLAADLAPQLALLPPADQLAAHALVAAIQPYLDQEVAANPNLATTRATLDTILQAVIDSCSAYGA